MVDSAGLDFEAIFEAAPTPYLVLTPDLVVMAVNRAYETVTGTPRTAVVGKPMFEAFPDDVDHDASPSTGPAATKDQAEDPRPVSGAVQLRASFERVLRTGQPDAMSLLRYAVADESGTFTTQWWSPLNAPVLDADGQVVMLLHRAERVTDYYLRRQQQRELASQQLGQDGRAAEVGPWEAAEADLYARGGELRRSLDQEQAAAEQLARMVDVSVRLSAASSVAELIDIVIHRGLAVLGAAGGAMAVAADAGDQDSFAVTADTGADLPASTIVNTAVTAASLQMAEGSAEVSAEVGAEVGRDEGIDPSGDAGGGAERGTERGTEGGSTRGTEGGADGGTGAGARAVTTAAADAPHGWKLVLTGSLGAEAEAIYAHIPTDSPLPVAVAARTGQMILLPDPQACLAFTPDLAEALRTTGLGTWLSVPLLAGGQVLGAITAGWRDPRPFTDRDLDVVRALVAQCAQTLLRLQVAEVERRAVAAERRAAEVERRAAEVERRAAEVERRAGDLARTSAARQGALVAIARALADANTSDDVLNVLAGQGADLLGANGCGLCLREPDGAHVVTSVTDAYTQVATQFHRVPADFPLPAIRAAATGQAFFLTDKNETEQAFPGSAAIYTGAGVQASAAVPLRARGQLLGCVSVGFVDPRQWTQDERELLAAFAALTAQALDRIAAHEAEQAALEAASGIAETLQRSMLTAPPEPDHLQIAVRYAASADHAEVGGDWYDAFLTSEGLTSLVIGDVTGHDMRAASMMGQLRNLVRGIAFTLGESPAKVLAAVDRAAAGLDIDTVATAIVAQVEQDAEHRAAGTRLLRWSNAGHLPPLLIEADGTTRFLDAESDLVLGWDPAIDRHDHEQVLAPGSTVLLYTDGLIERRGVHLDRGLTWLAEAAAKLTSGAAATLEELCDGLLALVGDHLDDDVALLALRAHAEDAPRPAQAGPVRVPAALDQALAAARDASA